MGSVHTSNPKSLSHLPTLKTYWDRAWTGPRAKLACMILCGFFHTASAVLVPILWHYGTFTLHGMGLRTGQEQDQWVLNIMGKCSHWSEAGSGTRTHCFLLCQSHPCTAPGPGLMKFCLNKLLMQAASFYMVEDSYVTHYGISLSHSLLFNVNKPLTLTYTSM